MAEEVNHQNKRARLILDEVNYEDSEHTFYLDLPPYSQKDKLIKVINDRDWPKVSFSFSDGNLTGVENKFTLFLGCDDEEDEEGNICLIYYINYKLKPVPWKFNKKLDSIIVKSAQISFVNKLDESFGDVLSFDADDAGVEDEFRTGETNCERLNWVSDYSGIKIAINVSKREEKSVDIVPSNPMMVFPNSDAHLSKVGKTRFSEYFLSEHLSDCKVVVGEKAFPVHRLVLAGISGFFKRMFLTDMVENQNRVWKIDDFEPEVVEEFLEYAYKGTSKNLALAKNTEILMELFRMGHKYDTVPLKAQCEELLKNLINAENVVDLFHLGFLYKSRCLANAAKYQFNSFYKLQLLPNQAAVRELEKKYPDDMVYELLIK